MKNNANRESDRETIARSFLNYLNNVEKELKNNYNEYEDPKDFIAEITMFMILQSISAEASAQVLVQAENLNEIVNSVIDYQTGLN